ncbi:VanZ family protein [Anaerobacillus sp. MEB173]|uniref:VanZ family protein n=1 Tax=Anaerobacillus sp. MEB173 TaxID=3383345 RepID=UPI003F926FEB
MNSQPSLNVNEKKKPMNTIFFLLFLFYVLALIYVTLLAWNYGASLGPAGPGGRNYNITPFRSIYRIAVYSPTIIDPIKILLGNVVLFIPFGFLLPLVVRKLKFSIIKVTFAGMCVSILIESAQFLFTYRVSNIDDVILNTVGTFIGVTAIKFIVFLKRKIHIFVVKKQPQ